MPCPKAKTAQKGVVRMSSLRRRMCATAKGNAEWRIVPCGC
jgi:hypothetical protein